MERQGIFNAVHDLLSIMKQEKKNDSPDTPIEETSLLKLVRLRKKNNYDDIELQKLEQKIATLQE